MLPEKGDEHYFRSDGTMMIKRILELQTKFGQNEVWYLSRINTV